MITTPTTFVIGAGASVPYAFPTGVDLARIIMGDTAAFDGGTMGSPLRRKRQVANGIEVWVRAAGGDIKKFAELRTALRYAQPLSIDALLMQREEFIDVGKLAIAAALLPFELDTQWSLFPYAGDWIGHLVQALYEDGEGTPEETVRFATFNYDRVVEHRLTLALSALRGVPVEDAWEEVRRIPMVHIYGPLGEYAPQHEEGKVTWGGDADRAVTPERIQLAASSIRLVHERGGTEELTPEVITARRYISESNRVWFLGFGFDSTNVSRLASSLAMGTAGYGEVVFGSALGMTEAERTVAIRNLSTAFKGPSGRTIEGHPEVTSLKRDRIKLVSADCLMTLREHADKLA